jgi:hypothetical protein
MPRVSNVRHRLCIYSFENLLEVGSRFHTSHEQVLGDSPCFAVHANAQDNDTQCADLPIILCCITLHSFIVANYSLVEHHIIYYMIVYSSVLLEPYTQQTRRRISTYTRGELPAKKNRPPLNFAEAFYPLHDAWRVAHWHGNQSPRCNLNYTQKRRSY